MIMLWNRREVFVGSSMQRFNEIRNMLALDGIKYTYRVVDSTSPYFGSSNRARTDSFGVNMNYSKTYYIYVHKRDYENACAILRS